MILIFFDARKFCFDGSFDVSFFYKDFDFPGQGKSIFQRKMEIHRKMEHQNFHQNKIRERQKIENH